MKWNVHIANVAFSNQARVRTLGLKVATVLFYTGESFVREYFPKKEKRKVQYNPTNQIIKTILVCK